MNPSGSRFTFSFYRFTGEKGKRTTETVRDYSSADGMKGLIDHQTEAIEEATQRVLDWARSRHLSVTPRQPFPSAKYPAKVWLEFRFAGLTL